MTHAKGRIILKQIGFLLFALLLALPSAAFAETPAEAVQARAEAMYGVMLNKNARHYRLREELAPYFLNEEELSVFLVRLAKDLDSKGIYTNRLESRSVKVLEADPSYGFAETKTELEGNWLLWFNRSLERTDRWKLINGQWYVNPPPLKNLEFE
jgi:hypothetical protein